MTMRKKSQGSPEFSVVVSFVMLIFLIILLIVFQKQGEAYGFQVFLAAKKAATTVADNINTISKNGHGYYKYFSIPELLHGYTQYAIEVEENFLYINYSDENWASPLITSNATILSLQKGESVENCVYNEHGKVVVNDVCGFSDRGCGSVQSCDPGDVDTCPTCDTPNPVSINQNSLSSCSSYGCSTDEWHFYSVVPSEDGRLKVTFRGLGGMVGDQKTDLIFYDYSVNGCNAPEQIFQLERQNSHMFDVQAGNTYIIGLDVDSPNCNLSGSYTLTTQLK